MIESGGRNTKVEKTLDTSLVFNESGVLLAPNGEISHFQHNLELAKFVRKNDFLAWFGDWIHNDENVSVAVHKDTNEPILFSHRSHFEVITGTTLSVEHDKTFGGEHGLARKALYFTTANLLEYGPYVHKAFLNLRNPATDWFDATEINDGVFMSGVSKGDIFYHACVFSDEQVFEFSRGKE